MEGKLVLQTSRFQTNNNSIGGGEIEREGGGLLNIGKCYQYENGVFARLDIFSSRWMLDTTLGKKDDWKSRQHLLGKHERVRKMDRESKQSNWISLFGIEMKIGDILWASSFFAPYQSFGDTVERVSFPSYIRMCVLCDKNPFGQSVQ